MGGLLLKLATINWYLVNHIERKGTRQLQTASDSMEKPGVDF
jgi:hypothetical protein